MNRESRFRQIREEGFPDVERRKEVSDWIINLIFVCAILTALALVSVIVWAIIRVVLHFT